MNIQQYLTPELLLSLLVVGTMMIVYMCFRLTGMLHRDRQLSDEHVVVKKEINNVPKLHEPRPSAGQLWYPRTGDDQPFIDSGAVPVSVVEYRMSATGEWVKFKKDSDIVIERIDVFRTKYMVDQFGDVEEQIDVVEPEQPELDLVIEFEDERPDPQTFSNNVLSIDGKNYVLSPV